MISFMYTFALAPAFLYLYIHYTRKICDIGVIELFAMIVTSFIPVLKEFALVYVWVMANGDKPLFKKVVK